jgi:hypothetical protein
VGIIVTFGDADNCAPPRGLDGTNGHPSKMCAEATMKSVVSLAVLVAAAACASACVGGQNDAATTEKSLVAVQPVVSEKAFESGGTIDIQLDGGDYELRAVDGNRIRVSLNGNVGNAKADLTADGTRAEVKVRDTPHNNFRATIEVPQTANLVVRLSGGNLTLAPIAGNKDVDATAGNITIGVGDANDYASVDASVKAGDLVAGPFGETKSGLLQHFTWSGHGKYTLRANLGAGNLVLRNK